MKDDEFEWDDNKAAQNFADHGVSFETARNAFSDPFGIELLDDRENYFEDRFILIAMAAGTLLTIAYTDRNGRYRLISARTATKNEQNAYFQQKL